MWVKYPNSPKLHDVEDHLIVGTVEAAAAHLEKMRQGTPPPPQPPPNEAR